ncbi:MAG: hypothetical protein RR177_03180 [Oscillospiraceae bacterium]
MNINTKQVLLTSLICFFSILSIIIIAAFSANINADVPKANQQQPAPMYIVREYGGKIAVFKYGEQNPLKIYDDPSVLNLPASDQSDLLAGIDIYTEQELFSILEDLGG